MDSSDNEKVIETNKGKRQQLFCNFNVTERLLSLVLLLYFVHYSAFLSLYVDNPTTLLTGNAKAMP